MSRPQWPLFVVTLGVGAVALVAAEPTAAQQIAPPEESGASEEQFEAALAIFRQFLGMSAFVLGVGVLAEISVVQSKGRLAQWFPIRTADRRYAPRRLAFRIAIGLLGCGWGVALYAGGAPIRWMALVTVVAAAGGALLFGFQYRSVLGWGQ